MGCDIHLKTYIYSKMEKKMVPVASVLSEYCTSFLPRIVEDRNYDLFGLFGNSARSNYPELDCFEPIPKRIANTSLCMYVLSSRDFHTVRWCRCEKLKKSLQEYMERLLDPKKYLEWYGDDADGLLYGIHRRSKKKFRKIHEDIIWSIDSLLVKISNLEEFLENEYSLNDICNLKKIAFLTWMDS